MPLPYAGHLAALGTASCWVASALAFEAAARRVGALSLNLIRLVFAFVLLSLACWLLRGLPFPVDASAHAWVWLGISGLVGFVFGDYCLFRAFLEIGPRLSSVLMALAPLFATLIGWLALGEVLGPRDLLGMSLTVLGVAWAVLDRTPAGGSLPSLPIRRTSGIALGLGGALGQGGGLVLSKLGMGDYNPWAATQVRVLAGAAGYALLLSALRWWPRLRAALADRQAMGYTVVGSFFGPFLGVSLSLISVQLILAGVAASLMALTPILIIPAVVLLRRERVGPGGVAGAVLAVAGVALLFL